MKKILFFALLSLFSNSLAAQNIVGRVNEVDNSGAKRALIGAYIEWLDSDIATVSDAEGAFTIKTQEGKRLRASFVGYQADTILYRGGEVEFTLQADPYAIEEVTVRNNRSNFISKRSIEKREDITFAGLCKMACCNLAESFENSASVTVGYSDAVTGARQIKMLGYSGTYTQMLDESRPIMRGLSAPYGLEYTPGMWLQGIQISKGITSVTNGFEALTGQINVEHRKPTDDEPLFVNLYLGQDLRTEANITSSFNLSDKLSTIILTHASVDSHEMDKNEDGFLDTPLKQQFNVANRWLYTASSGAQLRFGVKALYEKREGGQVDFQKSDLDNLSGYGSEIDNRHLNAYFKVGIPVITGNLQPEDEGYEEQTTSNIALVTDYVYHEQDAFFGIKDYSGAQNSVFANLLYQIDYGTRHQLITGASFTGDFYNESLMDRYVTSGSAVESAEHIFDRDLYTIGAFSEYSLTLGDKLNVIAGVRGDHNNRYGWMFTPRAHAKWNITPTTTLRGSVGVGYRIMSLVTDNIGMLATGRKLSFADDLNPLERGVTAGVSLTQSFKLFGSSASLSVDYFRSGFSDQVIVDQESDPSAVLFYNLDGDSRTDTYQVDFSYAPITSFTIFATFRYNDAKTTLLDSRTIETPLVSRYKGLINLQYATKFNRWVFDFTAQMNGKSRLPSQTGDFSVEKFSPAYPMFFAQVTHRIRKVDLYLGCENIANYRQSNPIISPESPFSTSFNSTVIWGPLMGRKLYIGLRYTL